jgi:hypothetical protein
VKKSDERRVISNVEKLQFGPPSDIFSQALKIALCHIGESVDYEQILCISGRAFKICWNDEMFFWDRFADEPDPDPEYYLRSDYESAAGAIESIGYAAEIVINDECSHPEESPGNRGDNRAIRDLIFTSIGEGRPVIAQLSASSERWAPEWSLITGYDDHGAVITGWSCFQNDELEKEALEFEPEGYFRKPDWEKDIVAAIRISGEKKSSDADLERQALEYCLSLSPGSDLDNASVGLATYERWARALEDESNGSVDDRILKGRLHYYTHFIGHLAAQKWYTASFLKSMPTKVGSICDALHAAAGYAKIHELMWECWKVAGGYWRDSDGELEKFRNAENRQKIAAFVRQAGELDRSAVGHVESALAVWERSHSYYMTP